MRARLQREGALNAMELLALEDHLSSQSNAVMSVYYDIKGPQNREQQLYYRLLAFARAEAKKFS